MCDDSGDLMATTLLRSNQLSISFFTANSFFFSLHVNHSYSLNWLCIFQTIHTLLANGMLNSSTIAFGFANRFRHKYFIFCSKRFFFSIYFILFLCLLVSSIFKFIYRFFSIRFWISYIQFIKTYDLWKKNCEFWNK